MKSSRLEPGSPEDDELEVLVTLVDAYEEKHFPIGMPHPVEAIKIRMEDLGLSRKDLMEHLGKSSGRVSDILNCRRALTLGDVRTLSSLLHLPAEVLLQEYPLEEGKPKEDPQSDGKCRDLLTEELNPGCGRIHVINCCYQQPGKRGHSTFLPRPGPASVHVHRPLDNSMNRCGRHPRETHPAPRCHGSKRGSESPRWKLVRFLA